MRGDVGQIICWHGRKGLVHFGEIIDFNLHLDVVVQEIHKMKKSCHSQHWIYTFKKTKVRSGLYWTLPFDKKVIHNPEDAILREPEKVLELRSRTA